MKRIRKISVMVCCTILSVVLLRSCVITSFLIPSAGMENSLYQGERIIVNKWSYGLRLPLMKWWGYRRWSYTPAARNDIVVFNNPANLHQPLIDHRETYIGRVAGIPGDTLMADSLFRMMHSNQYNPDQKLLYSYPRHYEKRLMALFDRESIAHGTVLGSDSLRNIRSLSRYEYYLLQQCMTDTVCWLLPLQSADKADSLLHPIVIPACGKPVRVTRQNITLLRNTLVMHEHRQAEISHDTLWVDGQPVQHVTFCQNYYWIETDNAANPQDSRLFGFVPHSHLIGRATRVWLSKEQDTGIFSGYRFGRIGTAIK